MSERAMPEQWPVWLSYGVADHMMTRLGYRVVTIGGARVLQPGPNTVTHPGAVRGSGTAYVLEPGGWSYLYDVLTCPPSSSE
jgi:hypothetical protein